MQRYSVTIISPGIAANDSPTLIVPFRPTALVQAFIDELWKRVIRQNIPLAPNTHSAVLHIDSATGAIVDSEDVLADVVDPKEKLFAVFGRNGDQPATPAAALNSMTMTRESVAIRIITPALAKSRDACPVIQIPTKSTIRQMHDCIADHLHIRSKFDDDPELLECNCKLATDLANGSTSSDHLLVVHGKSIVERLQLQTATEAALREALHVRFNADIEVRKRVHLHDAVLDPQHPGTYLKTPVVQICSKARHAPKHARVTYDEDDQPRYNVLDLHTSEQPISPACFSSTIEDAGLAALAHDNTIDLFAINRAATSNHSAIVGKSSIYRSRPHWDPKVLQSDRGVAMFLSSLRVFVSLVQDMKGDERAHDAVLHTLDLLTNFDPAVRAIHILVKGNTINSAESASISHALFEVLNDFLPTTIVGSDQSRLFEGARLLFSFILDKARSLKLPEGEGGIMPYLSSYQTLDLRDHKTNEAVLNAVQTPEGLVEADLFDAFLEDGVLSTSALQLSMMKMEMEASKRRHALFGGGMLHELTVFSVTNLTNHYRYVDSGSVSAAIDLDELTDLSHLAELAGRNKLAVHKPAQLASAVAPCLTFDSKAHLSVYTGEQPCGNPGHSSLIFRPMHGEETIDTAVVEQLIDPMIQTYKANGTVVFDALGGAIVRMLEAPDEIVIFAVDTSASMRQSTDFLGANEDDRDHLEADETQPPVDAQFYARATFEEVKERLSNYEGFEDMIAIVSATSSQAKQIAAGQALKTLRGMLALEIEKNAKAMADRMQLRYRPYHTASQEIDLNNLKKFWAGLKTFDEPLCDFLVYRSNMISADVHRRWTWSLNDDAPSTRPVQQIPNLPEDLIDLPHDLRCPISHMLMEDAVTAADGHSYSEAAIRQWFNIRSSSPMTGLMLDSTLLRLDLPTREAARRWAEGAGVLGPLSGWQKRLKSSRDVVISFDSKIGAFQRSVPPQIAVRDLYRLAFRGLKGRYSTFQLSTDLHGPMRVLPQHSGSYSFKEGDRISVRIAEDGPTTTNTRDSGNNLSTGYALIKVFEREKMMAFAYWVKTDDFTSTLASVMWKYHRYHYRNFGNRQYSYYRDKQVWTGMEDMGDGLSRGHPRDNSERLNQYLFPRHCTGILGDETLFDNLKGNPSRDAPLVLKIKVNSKWKPRSASRFSRLDVLKQMFEALVNRIHAYSYKTHIGLVTFASECRLAMGISHVLENFRRATGEMEAEGNTALWDALALAKHELDEYGKKYPDAKKRVICITDGADSSSTNNTSSDLCWRFHQGGILLDAVSLGDEENHDIRTMSHMLGCYLFHPTSLVNALAICEMEPFLSLSERPPIAPPTSNHRARSLFIDHFMRMRYRSRPTVVTAEQIPPRKQHPNLGDYFVEISKVTAKPGLGRSEASGGNWRSNMRTKRLMNEMTRIASTDHPTYDIYFSETDMSFWKVVMSGPEGTPYENGTFLLYIHADENYPTFSPKARFITKMLHPNINMHGRICHGIFDRDWTSDVSMTALLDTVYGLLLQAEFSDLINTTTTLSYHHDEVEFADEVREYVRKYAAKTKEEWREEILEG